MHTISKKFSYLIGHLLHRLIFCQPTNFQVLSIFAILIFILNSQNIMFTNIFLCINYNYSHKTCIDVEYIGHIINV